MVIHAAPSVAVMVVEDDILVRMVAADILADAGFRVVEARNAQEALTLLDARSDVRVVFTDCNMPGAVDGIGLARLINERAPEVGLLLTSGKVRPAATELPPGARFIPKPYRRSTVIEEVEGLLGVADEGAKGAALVPQSVTGKPSLVEGGEIAAAPLSEPDKT
ncbi:response regulator [Methylobacterium iners]|uniref:Sensor histidine kinase RcsC n=1 Tax=Methylobacterium iners TaxID=418707 RepID=A0ABQ4RTT5_9HYPH|nr:response regulator [Methylobacterium iners]GJD94134.1 Sensor histidine kinase RcsC [Methylobacterium iners]